LQLYCFWFLLIAQRGVQVRDLKRRSRVGARRQRPREAGKAKPAKQGETVRSVPALAREPSQERTPSRDRGPVLGAPRRADSTCLRRDKSAATSADGAGNPRRRVCQTGRGLS
jgi:hypothetical protein